MNKQPKPTSGEPLDEDRYERMSQSAESEDFEIPADAVVHPHPGQQPAGREFLADYMSADELKVAVRRGRGRPSLSGRGHSQPRQVRLPADLDALLVERAATEGRPMSDVLRAAVAQYLRPPAA